jgi:hypothetical protein
MISEAMANPAVELPVAHDLQEHIRKADKWIEKVRKLIPKKQDAERTEVTIGELEGLSAQAKEMRLIIPLAAELSQVCQQLTAWHQQANEALGHEITIERLEALVQQSEDIPVAPKEAAALAKKLKKARGLLLLTVSCPFPVLIGGLPDASTPSHMQAKEWISGAEAALASLAPVPTKVLQ